MRKRMLLGIAAAVFCGLLLFTGCSGGEPVNESDPGKLCCVRYDYVNGSAYGADFHIELNREQVVSASYFNEDDRCQVSGAPLEEAVWQAVEMLAEQLHPQLEPAQKRGLLAKLFPARDKGTDVLTLTWETADGPAAVQYRRCFSETETELLTLLNNIARACPRTEG